MNLTELENLLEKQKTFFYAGNTIPVKFRKEALKKLLAEIKIREKEIIQAIQKDLGKSEFEAFTNEVGILYLEIRHMLKNLSRWTRPVRAKLEMHLMPASGQIHYEPYGCTLIIAPWNYPFQLMIAPLIAALTAGNTAILKPSEYSVHTSKIITELIQNTFNEEYVAVVNGAAEETSLLLKLKLDKIFFTGSVPVGKIVMRAASENLTPVTLELGGKSPAVVDGTASLKLAARKIAWAKFNNAGQTCVAPDYVLVEKTVSQEFLKELKEAITEFYGDNPMESPHYGRIINQKHFSRLDDLIHQEKIFIGGQTDSSKLYIAPTVLTEVTVNDPVMGDEIFGPILPVLTYENLSNAVEIIRSYTKPLALYLFTRNPKMEKFFMEHVSFGGGGINTALLHVATSALPFGGVGHSGTGSYHGRWGFEEFSNMKAVLKQPSFIDPGIVYPGKQLPLGLVRIIMG
jgi:aldehyde dehydrogenase (NAD+)